jgi:hypothetical protein
MHVDDNFDCENDGVRESPPPLDAPEKNMVEVVRVKNRKDVNNDAKEAKARRLALRDQEPNVDLTYHHGHKAFLPCIFYAKCFKCYSWKGESQ